MEDVIRSISTQRLEIYEDYFSCSSKAEALGMYLWNQRVSSEFSCIIQIIEISLRNSIYNAYIEKKSNDEEWFVKYSRALPKSEEGRRQIDYVIDKQLSHKAQYSINDVISRLPFGYWTSMCRDEHNESISGSLELWPSLLPFVFKGRTSESQDDIFHLIVQVNKFRNRISHHEVIWKDVVGFGLASSFNKIFNSFSICLKLASIIGIDNLKIIEISNSINRLKELCTEGKVEEYKKIISDWSSINPNINNVFDDVYLCTEVTGVITSIKPNKIIIQSTSCLTKDGKQIKFKIDNGEMNSFSSCAKFTPIKFTPYVYRNRVRGNFYVAKNVSLV